MLKLSYIVFFIILVSINANAFESPALPTSIEQLDSTKIQAQREDFKKLSKQLNGRRLSKKKLLALQKKMTELQDYSLYPYLELALIKHDLAKRPIAEITSFIIRYKELPFIPSFRRLAISKKFKRRKYHDVIALHKEGNSTKYQCYNIRSLYKTGQQQYALSLVENLWRTGSSLPKICDPLLKAWRKAGLQTQTLLMERIELALVSRNHKLAKYLAKSLNKKNKRTFDYWYKVYRSPALLSKNTYWQHTDDYATTQLNIGLERLIYQRIELAMPLIDKIRQHSSFSQRQRDKLINRMVLQVITKQQAQDTLSLRHWLEFLRWDKLTANDQSQVLRYLVGQNQWKIIDVLYRKLWQTEPAPLQWQYWYASALTKLKQPQKAKELLTALAKKRRYYGFLASDKLNLPYSLNHQVLPINQQERAALIINPRLIRAYQLYQLDKNLEARREWYQLVKSLNQSQRISAAQIAHEWDWHDRAIITLTMTSQRDDLNLRFPTPYIDSFSVEAKREAMDLSWPIAIARQESAFMPQANSSVGARGLMQLMPGTAKLQAKQSHVRYYRKSQLYKPSFNIKLGTGYLGAMLDRFDDNLAVAAAAYNAGPHRVKHWVKEGLPQDQWVETIPYRETRQYVKNVLTYSVIYQQRLTNEPKLPSADISPHRMRLN